MVNTATAANPSPTRIDRLLLQGVCLVALALLGAGLLAPQSAQAQCQSDLGGTPGDWTDPATWTNCGGSYPDDPTDDAVIRNGNVVFIRDSDLTTNGGNLEIGNLTIDGTTAATSTVLPLDADNGTTDPELTVENLTILGGSLGYLTMNRNPNFAGSLFRLVQVNGDLTLDGEIRLGTTNIGGDVDIQGDLDMGPSGSFTFNAGAAADRTIEFNGDAVHNLTGTDDKTYPAIVVMSGDTLDVFTSNTDTGNGKVFQGPLTVDGVARLNADNVVTGNIRLTDSLQVKGQLTAQSNVDLNSGGIIDFIGLDSEVQGDLNVNSGGEAVFSNNTLIIGDIFINDGGSAVQTATTIRSQGDFSTSGTGTFAGNGNTIRFNDTAQQIVDAPGATFGNLVVENTTSLTISNTLLINGDMQVATGSVLDLDTGTTPDLTVAGNTTNSGTINGSGGSIVTFQGDFTNNDTYNTRDDSTSFEGNFNIGTSAQFDGGSASLLNFEQNFTFGSGGTFATNGGTSYFTGSTLQVLGGTASSVAFDDLIVDQAATTDSVDLDLTASVNGNLDIRRGTLALENDGDPLDVNGNLTIFANGALSLSPQTGGDLRVSGNFSNSGDFSADRRTVTLDGTGAQTVDGAFAGESAFARLIIDNSGSGVSLASGAVAEVGVEVPDPEGGTNFTGTLTLQQGTFDVSAGSFILNSITESRTARITGTGTGTIAGDLTVERFLDNTADEAHFRFLGVPVSGQLDNGAPSALLSNVWTQTDAGAGGNVNEVGAPPSVYEYVEGRNLPGIGGGADTALGWDDVSNLTGTNPIGPGDGFLVYLFQRNGTAGPNGFPVTLRMSGPFDQQENDGSNAAPSITFTSDDDGIENNGWNLVGNPFLSAIDWELVSANAGNANIEATYYVWDSENSEYDEFTAGGVGGPAPQNIALGSAFFVKATGASPSLEITSADKTSAEAEIKRETTPERPVITLNLVRGTRTVDARFSFGEEASASKDAYDAYQLVPLSQDYMTLSSSMRGSEATFAHQFLPEPTDGVTLDLNVETTYDGAFSIELADLKHVPEQWTIELVDTATGQTVDLRAKDAEHTFTVDPAATLQKGDSIEEMLKRGTPKVAQKADGLTGRFQLRVQGALDSTPATGSVLQNVRTQPDDAGVVLKWETARETSGTRFHVQRQTATGFDDVHVLDGGGLSKTPQAYSHRVDDLTAGTHTFRIKMVDDDGTEVFSKTVEGKMGLNGPYQLNAFPNPFRGRATVQFAVKDAGPVTVEVYNTLGQRVRTLYDDAARPEQTVTTSFDAQDLSSGLYIVRMRGEDFSTTKTLTLVR